MTLEFCIPVIPSADLEKSLRFWIEGLGFTRGSEMHDGGRLVFCMINNGGLTFMLNRRAGTTARPDGYEGIRLYWTPSNIGETRQRLIDLGYKVSELVLRDYGQTEFFVIDDDGYDHCFGIRSE